MYGARVTHTHLRPLNVVPHHVLHCKLAMYCADHVFCILHTRQCILLLGYPWCLLSLSGLLVLAGCGGGREERGIGLKEEVGEALAHAAQPIHAALLVLVRRDRG